MLHIPYVNQLNQKNLHNKPVKIHLTFHLKTPITKITFAKKISVNNVQAKVFNSDILHNNKLTKTVFNLWSVRCSFSSLNMTFKLISIFLFSQICSIYKMHNFTSLNLVAKLILTNSPIRFTTQEYMTHSLPTSQQVTTRSSATA